jgi:hypothetical protein
VQRYVVRGVFLATGVVSVHGIVVGCSEVVPTSYGNPNTLDRKNLPGEGGVEPLNCAAAAADGGGGGADAGCPSFRDDIYPLVKNTGPWKCSDAKCHATAQQPIINVATAEECLVSLQQIKLLNRAYVPADGNRDPSASTFLCNLQGTCGSPMPKPPQGSTPTGTDLCKVEAWIKCGSPLD